jgi:DedD protein
MARPISDEELQLKKRARRRLVGAIVLVTAVAVILPMVLDSEPKPVSQNVDIQIPSPDSGEFKPKAPAASAPAADGSPIKGMPPAPKSGSPESAAKADPAAGRTASTEAVSPPPVAPKEPPRRDEASSDASADTAKPTRREEAKANDAASPGGAYVVQVAALADSARVKQLQKQMAAAGVKTYTEVISTKAGEITRVRAGPYATKEAAETARTQLRKAGLDGKVVPK